MGIRKMDNLLSCKLIKYEAFTSSFIFDAILLKYLNRFLFLSSVESSVCLSTSYGFGIIFPTPKIARAVFINDLCVHVHVQICHVEN